VTDRRWYNLLFFPAINTSGLSRQPGVPQAPAARDGNLHLSGGALCYLCSPTAAPKLSSDSIHRHKIFPQTAPFLTTLFAKGKR
jgi:hypothetical protein